MDMFEKITFLTFFCSVVSKDIDIFKAVREDDEAQIKLAISNGIDINTIGPAGQTPLMNAVLQGKKIAAKTLLDLGADTSIGEKDGYPPIHGAGFQGRAEIAQLLIDHGVDASDQHRDGHTPIHRACWGNEKRHTDTVRVFLENGVPYGQKSANGDTPSKAAKKFGNKGTIKLLKEWKAKQEL